MKKRIIFTSFLAFVFCWIPFIGQPIFIFSTIMSSVMLPVDQFAGLFVFAGGLFTYLLLWIGVFLIMCTSRMKQYLSTMPDIF